MFQAFQVFLLSQCCFSCSLPLSRAADVFLRQRANFLKTAFKHKDEDKDKTLHNLIHNNILTINISLSLHCYFAIVTKGVLQYILILKNYGPNIS